MSYQPGSVAAAFERVLLGEDPRIAVGDFLDDWRRTPHEERVALVRSPIREPGVDVQHRRWAAFLAAGVDQLCALDHLPSPAWTAASRYRLPEPWFLVPGLALRAYQLVTTPVPFKARNIFGGESLLSRA